MMMMTRWKEGKKERDAQCHGERHKHTYVVDYFTTLNFFL